MMKRTLANKKRVGGEAAASEEQKETRFERDFIANMFLNNDKFDKAFFEIIFANPFINVD